MCSHCAANHAMREYLMRVAIRYIISCFPVRELIVLLINESYCPYRFAYTNKLVRRSQAVLLRNERYSANYLILHKVKVKNI